MISRRLLLVLLSSAASTALGVSSVACSSSSGSSSSGGTSGTVYVDSGNGDTSTATDAADSATPVDSGIAPGSVALAEGPCTADVDCAPNTRGMTACFMGGMGGGTGDGGSTTDAGPSSYCSLKCSPTGVANTTTCAAPFLEFCNMRGYCKLH